MATATYEVIATHTLSSDTTSYTFNSIPTTYTDLVLVLNYKNTKSIDTYGYPRLQFNGDTGSNYSMTALTGNGTSAASNRQSNQTSLLLYEGTGSASGASNIYGLVTVNILNYSNTTTYKTALVRGGSPVGTMTATQVEFWRNTAAITSIKIFDGSVDIASSSNFTLYGIKAT